MNGGNQKINNAKAPSWFTMDRIRLIAGIAVIVIIAVLVAVYYLNNKKSGNPEGNKNTEFEETATKKAVPDGTVVPEMVQSRNILLLPDQDRHQVLEFFRIL